MKNIIKYSFYITFIVVISGCIIPLKPSSENTSEVENTKTPVFMQNKYNFIDAIKGCSEKFKFLENLSNTTICSDIPKIVELCEKYNNLIESEECKNFLTSKNDKIWEFGYKIRTGVGTSMCKNKVFGLGIGKSTWVKPENITINYNNTYSFIMKTCKISYIAANHRDIGNIVLGNTNAAVFAGDNNVGLFEVIPVAEILEQLEWEYFFPYCEASEFNCNFQMAHIYCSEFLDCNDVQIREFIEFIINLRCPNITNFIYSSCR